MSIVRFSTFYIFYSNFFSTHCRPTHLDLGEPINQKPKKGEIDIDDIFNRIKEDEGRPFAQTPTKDVPKTTQNENSENSIPNPEPKFPDSDGRPPSRRPRANQNLASTPQSETPKIQTPTKEKTLSKLEKEFGSKSAHVDALKKTYKGVKK